MSARVRGTELASRSRTMAMRPWVARKPFCRNHEAASMACECDSLFVPMDTCSTRKWIQPEGAFGRASLFPASSSLRLAARLARMPGMSAATISHTDEINARILAVSEDRIAGFVREPMREIARGCGLPVELVIERIRAMLQAGTIRRVRQTLMATDLAPGALVAWEVAPERLHAAFAFLFQRDPLSGHLVVRSAHA